MDRRIFIGALTGGLFAVSLAARAQQPGKVPVVGVLHPDPGPRAAIPDKARQALRDFGYVDGKNIAFEIRFAGGKPETFPGLATDLVNRKVDVVVRINSRRGQLAVQRLQTWGDSGMMSACCSWRERSSESFRMS